MSPFIHPPLSDSEVGELTLLLALARRHLQDPHDRGSAFQATNPASLIISSENLSAKVLSLCQQRRP